MKYDILKDDGRTLLVQQSSFPWLIKRLSGAAAMALRKNISKQKHFPSNPARVLT